MFEEKSKNVQHFSKKKNSRKSVIGEFPVDAPNNVKYYPYRSLDNTSNA